MRMTAEADELWNELTLRAAAASPDRAATDALLHAIGDLLTERQAALLVATGYRTPPPPPAYALIDHTYDVVSRSGSDPAGGRQIEQVRAALREFVDQIATHLPAAEDRALKRILHFGRVAGISTAMLALAASLQVKTGNDFQIALGSSVEKWFSIEITLPVELGRADEVESLSTRATSRELLDILATISLDAGEESSSNSSVNSSSRPSPTRDATRKATNVTSSGADRAAPPFHHYVDDRIDLERYVEAFRLLESQSPWRDDMLFALESALGTPGRKGRSDEAEPDTPGEADAAGSSAADPEPPDPTSGAEPGLSDSSTR